MRPLTMKEVNRIGEVVSRQLPTNAVVDWKYRAYSDRQTMNITIRETPKQSGIFTKLDKGLKGLEKKV